MVWVGLGHPLGGSGGPRSGQGGIGRPCQRSRWSWEDLPEVQMALAEVREGSSRWCGWGREAFHEV